MRWNISQHPLFQRRPHGWMDLVVVAVERERGAKAGSMSNDVVERGLDGVEWQCSRRLQRGRHAHVFRRAERYSG